MRSRIAVVAAALVAGCGGQVVAPAPSPTPVASAKPQPDRMSPMGRLALHNARVQARRSGVTLFGFSSGGNCASNAPDCGDEDSPFVDPDVAVSLAATQSETSIAVDESGDHVVIGFNDFRGFARTDGTTSVSGVMRSDDGGETFVDGGQLPTGAKTTQVFGDPTVKYLGDCTFVYGSILVTPINGAPVQTMGLHRSTDCGKTWQGPFTITAASDAMGAADKEFLDVDPDTGRVMISWTDFTATGPHIKTAFSDDAATANPPTWSAGAVVSATPADGQGSMPAFARGSHDAYVAWTQFPGGLDAAIAFAHSPDDGATWDAPRTVNAPFFTIDYILGNDRVHEFPSIAVDNSRGRHRGTIYVVHADNDGHDGSDIALERSTDGGKTWKPRVILNSRPGRDRAQWFPSVSVDNTFGRVYVMYYDQGVATSGDLTQVSYTYSDDGGAHWRRPRALTDRPFHAGWGNDTSQPNLGDYIQGAALAGDLYSAYAVTHPVGFTDGQPGGQMTVPDVESKHSDEEARESSTATLQLGGEPTVRDSGRDGNIDPGELVLVDVPLTNYVTNPLNAATLRDVFAFATSATPGTFVLPTFDLVRELRPGETRSLTLALLVGDDFVAGTPIELTLQTFQGAPFGLGTLHVTLDSGRPTATVLMAENFDEVAPGALPPGWIAAHGGGANVVPWRTSNSFCGTSNAAFHPDAEDGPVTANGPGNPTRWERLISPLVKVPADAHDVTLEFDVCYDTEDDPSFNVLAYDGFFLRVFDATAGRTPRSVLIEAFESKFSTGDKQGYPKHLPRNSSRAYFEDMSAWAGDSQGVKHVKVRLPGMAGSTVQLRFEYTQDAGGICSDVRPGHACGVSVDNIVMSSVKVTP